MNVTAATRSNESSAAAALFDSINKQGSKPSAVDSTEFAKNRFLTLLTAQLQNQDPLNPMDNAQMTSQMAQISTVDGIERLNATLAKLIENSTEAQTLQMAGLVGRGVLVPGQSMELTDKGGVAGVQVDKPVDDVVVEIRDMNGLLMRTLNLGAQVPGSHAFAWDGLTNAGEKAVPGNYRITAEGRLSGENVAVERLQFGVVDGVVRSAQGATLNIEGLGQFTSAQIRQIL